MTLAYTRGLSPWAWHAHPEVWAVLGVAVVLYFVAIRRLGPGLAADGEAVVTRRQVALFASGVLVLWMSADYPIHDLAERYLYSVHMVQHMLISLVAPPLLIMGTPHWLQRWLLKPAFPHLVVRRLARPVAATVVFNLVVGIGHAPGWVNYTLAHHSVHFLAHLLLFAVSLLMWFPVVNTMPEFPTMSPPVKMVYLFVQSLVPNWPVAFLAFATGVVYKYYAHVPRPFPLSAVGDQQLAGAIMKIGGTLILWSVILVVFSRWYQQEHTDPPRRPSSMPDVLTWDDVQRELSRTQPAS